MFDPERMLGQMLGGALGGAFGGSRGKKKRRGGFGLGGGNTAMKAQVGLGLLGVAFAAYEHYTQQRGGFAGANAPHAPQGAGSHGGSYAPAPTPAAVGAMPPPPPGARTVPPPPPPAGAGTNAAVGGAFGPDALRDDPSGPKAPPTPGVDAIVVMQAMIAAAAADGRIDDDERANILARARDAGVDADGLRFLETELASPKPLAAVVAATRREIADDVYAASVLAISLDTEAERAYLDQLAHALSIDASRRSEIHARLEGAGSPL